MRNIEAAFGQIGDATSWKNGMLASTTKKPEFAITGFYDFEEMAETANARGHKMRETARTTTGEWVYSKAFN